MVKIVKTLATLGAATVNPDGSAVLDSSSSTTSPTCPISADVVNAKWHKYHGEKVCHRESFNEFKDSLNRHAKYNSLKSSGEHTKIPNAKTVTCPAVVHDLAVPGQVTGLDTSWIVENTASTPVVLSFVKDGVERSALNDISPAQADPEAILKPGEWKAVHTFEGHVFHARELLQDGSAGKVLLQHRTGFIPIGEKAGRNLVCPDVDDEPLVIKEDGTKEINPNFQRTKARPSRSCNTLEVGFRNVAGCPLHGYFFKADICQEVFKLHLGVEPGVADFQWDWKSPTKYESTFMGHTFVFRSAFSDQIVDQVTLQPTQITDCPDLKQTVATALATDAILLPTGNGLRDGNASNNTTSFLMPPPSASGGTGSSFFYAGAAGGSI